MPNWIAYHGRTGAEHQAQFNTLSQQGFRMISLSMYGHPQSPRYAAVWIQKSGPPSRAFHGASSDAYQGIFNSWTKDGYRPVIVTATGYPPVFAGVFEKSSTPFVARHNISRNTFQAQNMWARSNGFILRWGAAYGEIITETEGGPLGLPLIKDRRLYAGVWEPRPANVDDWKPSDWWPYTGSSFQDSFEFFTNEGYRLAFVTVARRHIHDDGGAHYYSVFRKGDSIGPWAARHGLTPSQYQVEVDKHARLGFMPVVVQAAGDGKKARFAVIFAKPSNVF